MKYGVLIYVKLHFMLLYEYEYVPLVAKVAR
jgi:hypothetical protein